MDGALRLSGDRENDLTKILGVTGLVGMWTIAVKIMLNSASQYHLGSLSAVGENDTAILRVAHAVLEDFPEKIFA